MCYIQMVICTLHLICVLEIYHFSTLSVPFVAVEQFYRWLTKMEELGKTEYQVGSIFTRVSLDHTGIVSPVMPMDCGTVSHVMIMWRLQLLSNSLVTQFDTPS